MGGGRDWELWIRVVDEILRDNFLLLPTARIASYVMRIITFFLFLKVFRQIFFIFKNG